jgi:hypothetical protein
MTRAKGDARGIVDGDMDIFPAKPFAAVAPVALAVAVAGDAVADAVDPAEFLDVDVDQFAGMRAFVAPDRFGRFERAEPVEPQAAQDAADGGRREPELGGDLLARIALAPQRLHRRAGAGRGLPGRGMGPRGTVLKTGHAVGQEAVDPLADRFDVV